MSLLDNNYDFVKEIKPDNISKVRANFQYKFNDYISFYVVDTYDIIEYCFPFIFNNSYKHESQLDVSKFMSYEFFFFELDTRPIVLDEYKVEIFSFWYRLKKKVAEFSNYENLKDALVDKYREQKTKEEKILFIEANIGILLSIVFGTLSSTPMERYNSLVTNRLQLDAFETENKGDEKIIEQIFTDTPPDIARVNAVFDKFCNSVKYRLLGMTEDEKFIYLENTYRDIKVFDRIVNINGKLLSHKYRDKLNKKYNFLYLSSAPVKSDRIETYYTEDLPAFPDVVSDSLHRTNLDTYLYQLLDIGDNPEDKERIISFLDKLDAVAKSYLDNSVQIEKYKGLFAGNAQGLNNNLLTRRKELDDIFLKYHFISRQHKKVNAAIKKLKDTGDDAALFKEFNDILEQASQEPIKHSLEQLQNSLDQYNDSMDLKSDIISDFNFLQSNKRMLALQGYPARDAIRSLAQAFPVLLFYQKKNTQLQQFFRHIISPSEEKREIVYDFINLPQSILFGFSTLEKKLFFLFLRYLFDKQLKEDQLLRELDTLGQLNTKSRLDRKFVGDNFLDVQFAANEALNNDLNYFRIWVLRRCNRQDDAIDIIDRLIREEKVDDMRLLHGRALCRKNQYYREADVQSADLLEFVLLQALTDFYAAEILYRKCLTENPENELLAHSLRAMSNSIVDSYTKLYLLNPEKYLDHLPDGRKRIVELKATTSQSGFAYDMYPTFGHTEVDLEYCEAMAALQAGDRKKAEQKITEANIRLDKIKDARSLTDYEPMEKSRKNLRKLARIVFIN